MQRSVVFSTSAAGPEQNRFCPRGRREEKTGAGINIVTGSEYYIIKRVVSIEHRSPCCAREKKQNQTEWRTEFPCKVLPHTSKTERLRLVQAQ
ncbi:hypothetical protein QQF64_022399 [Cirrhinus molitorella]|uniref:Uncharacterized protein n=1 Tax=Cirrhinus molitorella TaxID=172907 RepID=A0ABR3L832_9TELE